MTDIRLSDIDESTWVLQRAYDAGTQSRRLFQSKDDSIWLKLWNADFAFRPGFEDALRRSFFDGIAPLLGVVRDDAGRARGYATANATPLSWDTIDRSWWIGLACNMAARSIGTGIIYLDLTMQNVVQPEKCCYRIVDLEPCVHVDRIRECPISVDSALEYADYEYRVLIRSLYDSIGRVAVVRHGTRPDKRIEYGTANGRVWLEREFLPTLAGTTLFVGVNYYTEFYHLLTQNQTGFATVDVKPDRIQYGSPYLHYVGDVLHMTDRKCVFDTVVAFGLLGHLDDWDIIATESGVMACINVLDGMVRKGGMLVLGPATRRWPAEWWDAIYDRLEMTYERVMLRQIDINRVWVGRKT